MNVLSTATTKLTRRPGRTGNALKAGLLAIAIQFAPASMAGQTSIDVPDQAWSEFLGETDSAKQNMMSDPAKALDHAQKAGDLTKQFAASTRKQEAKAISLWLQSEALIRINRATEARPLLYTALELVGDSVVETKLVGDLRLALARVSRQTGEVGVALKSLHRAHDTFAQLGETRSQAMVLQGIGSIYNDARSFERALEYFERADEIYPSDQALELSAANNSANVLKELKRYPVAIARFNRALDISAEMGSPLLQGRILTNIASVQVMAGDLEAAEVNASRALWFLEEADDQSWSKFIWGIRAEVALARNENSKALAYIARTFVGSDIQTTTAAYRDMHEIAYRVYQANGLYVVSLNHLEAFKRLDDKGRELAATASLAVASASFDFTSQELRIEKLMSEQLNRDVELASTVAKRKMMNLLIIFIGSIAALFFGYVLSIRRPRGLTST